MPSGLACACLLTGKPEILAECEASVRVDVPLDVTLSASVEGPHDISGADDEPTLETFRSCGTLVDSALRESMECFGLSTWP